VRGGRRRHVTTTAEGFHASGRDLLEVVDLRTSFRTPRGVVKAVDGVSFTLQRGRTLGLVGESGCGKSVLSRSIMGLLPGTAERSGEVLFHGDRIDGLDESALRSIWGTRMAMVFQDPMTSLNPVMSRSRPTPTWIGRPPATPPCSSCGRCTSPSPNGASSSTRTSFRAACASGS
jgi:ABC-type oligopeptide transport system ATPase subunit